MRQPGIRVRGIYSTAIVRIFLDNGIPVADLSPILKKRFSLEKYSDENIPVTTIKDTENKKGFIVYGEPTLSNKAIDILRRKIRNLIVIGSKYNRYSTNIVKIVKKINDNLYYVELPHKEFGILHARNKYNIGDNVVAYTISGMKEIVLYEGIAIVGKYVRIMENEKTRFSKHIRDLEKKTLLLTMLANIEKPPNIGVYFRSSCNKATLSEILEEIQELIIEYKSLKEHLKSEKEISKITQGETLYVNLLSFESKNILDEYRRKQLATVSYHHYLKSTNTLEKDCLDIIESILVDLSHRKLIEYHIDKILNEISGKNIKFIHRWISLNQYVYGCQVYDVSYPLIYCKRKVTKEGIYDGLNIKKEPGDIIVTIFALFSPIMIHMYFRNNNLLGTYININSPVEVLSPYEFWYIDYHIDVIEKNNEITILDRDKLEQVYNQKIISKELYRQIIELSENIVVMLKNRVKKEKIILSLIPKEIYKK